MADEFDRSASIEEIASQFLDKYSRLRTTDSVIELEINPKTPLREILLTNEEVSGGGTSSTFDSNTNTFVLGATTTNGRRKLRNRVSGLFQPGKSLLYIFNGTFGGSGSISWVVRSSTSGTVVENSFDQANWNVDVFDGSGDSEETLEQVNFFEGFIGLSNGGVLCGFVFQQKLIAAHLFNFQNNHPLPFIKDFNLFPTYEIERAGGDYIKRMGQRF